MPYLRHFRTISTLVYVYSNRAIKASSVILSHFQAFQPCKSYMKIYIILEDSLLVTRLSGYCTGVRENYLETQTQKTQPIRPHFVCLSGGEMQRGSQSTKTGSDAHGVPAGKFSLTRTRTRRKPVPCIQVRVSC